MKFFYYCFYRISEAYGKWENDSYISGNVIVALCFAFNILTLIALLLSLKNEKLPIILVAIIIVSTCIINLFIMTKKKYEQLNERLKEENYKVLKGWLVLFYVLSSIGLYVASILYINS